MGTRSLTVVKDNGQTLVTIYRQYDGYLEGLGVDLASFIEPFTVVNGIGVGDDRKIANGMGCLAAQLIGHLKGEKAGNVYIYPEGSKNCGEEFIYTVSQSDGKPIKIECYDVYEECVIFKGTATELLAKVAAHA